MSTSLLLLGQTLFVVGWSRLPYSSTNPTQWADNCKIPQENNRNLSVGTGFCLSKLAILADTAALASWLGWRGFMLSDWWSLTTCCTVIGCANNNPDGLSSFGCYFGNSQWPWFWSCLSGCISEDRPFLTFCIIVVVVVRFFNNNYNKRIVNKAITQCKQQCQRKIWHKSLH